MKHDTVHTEEPTPFYDDGRVTLYHGNSRHIISWLAGDVLVTDPPYGIAYRSGWSRHEGDHSIAGDNDTAIRDVALDMWGAKPALVFGRWDVPRPADVRHRLIWDKQLGPGMGDLAMPWGHGEEEIYVLGAGWTGKRESNVIHAKGYTANAARRPDHPTPKPVALMEALIEKCPPGIIVDPFAGSGATLIAARNLGRRAIGIELERKYCDIIATRLSQQSFTFVADDEPAPVAPARSALFGDFYDDLA